MEKDNLAITYINTLTRVKQVNEQKSALANAIKAAFQCQEDIFILKLTPNSDPKELSEIVPLLAVSLYNMGQQ